MLCTFLSSLWVNGGILNCILHKKNTNRGLDWLAHRPLETACKKERLWPAEVRPAHLTVGVVAERLVRFIDDHTLDLLGGARLPRQVVHHDLRGQEEDTLGPPDLLPLLRRCAACTYKTDRCKDGFKQTADVSVLLSRSVYLSAPPCVPEGCPSPYNRPQSAGPPEAWWGP